MSDESIPESTTIISPCFGFSFAAIAFCFTVLISNTEVSDITLELVDISGQVVYKNQVKSVYSYTEEIDASTFARGIYYLRVNDGENVQIKKVVIQ